MRAVLRPDGRLIITGGYANWGEGRLDRMRVMSAKYFDLILEVTYDKSIEYAAADKIRFSKKHFMWLLHTKHSGFKRAVKTFMWFLSPREATDAT